MPDNGIGVRCAVCEVSIENGKPKKEAPREGKTEIRKTEISKTEIRKTIPV
jgi:hypothetical protein